MKDEAKLCAGVDVSIGVANVADGFDVECTIGFGLGVSEGMTVSIPEAESIPVVFVKE
jgi:hypothetical protein